LFRSRPQQLRVRIGGSVRAVRRVGAKARGRCRRYRAGTPRPELLSRAHRDTRRGAAARGTVAPPGATRLSRLRSVQRRRSDRAGVRLDGEAPADVARRHAVAVAVKLQSNIFVDQQFRAVAVVIRNDRQRLERSGLKAIDGPLARLAVLALIGDFGEPLTRLAI